MSASKGPILIIEDDFDDQEILKQVFTELNIEHQLIFFTNAPDAYNFLMSTEEKPFLIISDVNLPGMKGTEFRRKVCETDYLSKKSIPFVFLTTTARKDAVEEAYKLSVQGYFEKPFVMEELKKRIYLIVEYWKQCLHPYVF